MDLMEKVLKKAEGIRKCVRYLRSKGGMSVEALETDYEARSAIERNLQLAIEFSIDIGEMVISRLDLEKPENYRDVIITLGKNTVIPVDFAERFAIAAGLRNILIHMYDTIDLHLLKEIVEKKLGDFELYIKYILEFIKVTK
jgi:uncharacterized protein YutE (UPF0331/DUF86 family)